MNQLRQKIRRWLYKNNENVPMAIPKADPIEHYHHTINFSLIPAKGGFVLSVRRYHPHQDESERELYIIDQEANVGERIARIVNLEMIK